MNNTERKDANMSNMENQKLENEEKAADTTANESKTQAEQETVADAHDEYLTPDQAGQEQAQDSRNNVQYYIDLAKRIQADFDNYRKRNASVYSNALVDGKIEAVKAFLSVIDNLDRAIAAETETESSLYKGIKIIRTQIDEALTSLGVETIGQVGDVFDPQYHNAVMQAPKEGDQKPGQIAEVFLKGYKLGDRIIRHTMVKVTV